MNKFSNWQECITMKWYINLILFLPFATYPNFPYFSLKPLKKVNIYCCIEKCTFCENNLRKTLQINFNFSWKFEAYNLQVKQKLKVFQLIGKHYCFYRIIDWLAVMCYLFINVIYIDICFGIPSNNLVIFNYFRMY